MSLRVEGHLTSKSSPLAPVSCKLSKQFMVQQHLTAHYKNISNVKASIDNKCPKSWYKHVNVKDQIKRERISKSARENGRDNQSSILYQNKSFRSEYDDDNIQSTNRMYVETVKPLGPRIYKNDVKSKIAQLRCYNPPKKKSVVKTTSTPKMAPVAASSYQEPFEERPEKFEIKQNQNDETDLRYLSFCNDITNDILQNNIFTNRGINQIFDEHITRNRYQLKMDAMLKAYKTIRKELEGKSDLSRETPGQIDFDESSKINFHYDAPSYEINNEFDNQRKYFGSSDSNFDNRFHFTGDNVIYESYEDKDRDVINAWKPFDVTIEKPQENLSRKFIQQEYSTAPTALQWSLTSAEDGDTGIKANNEQPLIEHNIDKLCEDIYDVNIKDNEPELVDKINLIPTNEHLTNEVEDSNFNKNVHFAKHNEVYSATESEDHSLTDVTSMRLEESEDYEDNNDSTCVESSLDLNNTFKSEMTKENPNEIKYEDDFDD